MTRLILALTLASLFDSFSFLYFQHQDFTVLLNARFTCLPRISPGSAPTCSVLQRLRSCKLHFPYFFAGWPPARVSQWKALAGDWRVGRREKPGYFSPSLSLSLLSQCLGHSCTSSLAPAPPPRPTVVPAATEWPQLWGTSTPPSHLVPPAREVEAASSCWEIQGYLTSSPCCSFVSNA